MRRWESSVAITTSGIGHHGEGRAPTVRPGVGVRETCAAMMSGSLEERVD